MTPLRIPIKQSGWLAVAVWIMTICPTAAVGCGQDQSPDSSSANQSVPASTRASVPAETEKQALKTYRAELSEEDETYFRARTVLKYEHKFVPGDIAKDEFRSFNLYSFGPKKRWAITVEMPYLMFISTPAGSSTGAGDAEFKFGTMFQKTERFRQVVGVQLNTQTASDPVFGGAATVMKALYANSLVLNTRWIVNFSWNYAHSVHLSEGASTVSQMEPEVTLSRSLHGSLSICILTTTTISQFHNGAIQLKEASAVRSDSAGNGR